MCLMVVHFRVHPAHPLVVAANRDERYARATSPIALRSSEPLVLAGKDEAAGGTWLAVNEFGVVAGLTNQPMPAGPDSTKRSRGELPLLCTAQETAVEGVEAFLKTVDPSEYNPCWLLVGDRERLFALEVRADAELVAAELSPGRHVLENSPIDMPTAKSVAVSAMDQRITAQSEEPLVAALSELLASHRVAPPLPRGVIDPRATRRPELSSACVHSDGYGTRSSTIALVPAETGRPNIRFADGAPCVTEFRDVSGLWNSTRND